MSLAKSRPSSRSWAAEPGRRRESEGVGEKKVSPIALSVPVLVGLAVVAWSGPESAWLWLMPAVPVAMVFFFDGAAGLAVGAGLCLALAASTVTVPGARPAGAWLICLAVTSCAGFAWLLERRRYRCETELRRELAELRSTERWGLSLEGKLLETQKLRSIGVLTSSIAHDFNNLLTPILGNASLAAAKLAAGSDPAPQLEQIQTSAQRASELVRELLVYAGRARAEKRSVSLVELVREMRRLLEVSMPENVRWQVLYAREEPRVEADPSQLRQVVMNLITNAAEAIGGRPGTVTVATGVAEIDRAELARYPGGAELEPGRYAWLEVADDGEGMDEATAERIFDPFFTTKEEGHGLGLAAVLGILGGHRGAVRVDSRRGRGTCFRVLLPLAAADGARAEALAEGSGGLAAGAETGVDLEPRGAEKVGDYLAGQAAALAATTEPA